MNEPIALFQQWLAQAEQDSRLSRPRVCCLSTVDEDGAPDARVVDLKGVTDAGFVFSTSLASRKARALASNPRAALTFWWDPVERQVRVAGVAARVAEVEADALFRGRPREAQLASWASRQGAELDDPASLDRALNDARQRFANITVPRPEDWGAFRVAPERIEFLRFQENRLHQRVLYLRDGSLWRTLQLQP
jgi:pyridoxamine 5'-phosphate oxidase